MHNEGLKEARFQLHSKDLSIQTTVHFALKYKASF